MATSSIEPLKKGINVSRWLQRFEAQMTWQAVNEEKKKYALIALLGPEAFELVADSCLPREPAEKTYKELVEIIKKQLMPTKLPIAARYEFYQLRQGVEDVKTYVRKLQHASDSCAFGNQLNDRLRDQLVIGLSSKEAVKRMLTEKLSDLTLEKTIEIATAFEAVHDSQKQLTGNMSNDSVCYVRKKPNFRQKTISQAKEARCLCCGKIGHAKEQCFFRKQKCNICGRLGHLKAVCKAKGQEKAFSKTTVQNIEEEETLFNIGKGLFKHIVRIQGRKVEMIFDTGAEVSLINERVYNALCRFDELPLLERQQNIKAYGHVSVPIMGEVSLNVEDNEQNYNVKIIVAKGTSPCIYGCDLIKLFRPKFSVNSIRNQTASLHLKEGVQPIFFRPRPLPYGLMEPVKNELQRLVKENVLMKVKTSEWATPIVPVIKPNGSVRLCGDYKVTLNPHLKDMVSTTRPLDDIVSSMVNSRWFSELDLKNAYHQIPLDEGSSKLTTLCTPFGLFRHLHLPFGIKTSPAIFQNTMEILLDGIPGVEIYQDNIYVHAASRNSHDDQLKQVRQRLATHKFELNEGKCHIRLREMNVLGSIVNGAEIKPDPAKTSVIKSLPAPLSVKELRSFLGMVEFYGKFIPKLSTIKEPLTKLTRKGERFCWGRDQEKSFEDLKQSLCTDAALRMFDPGKSVTVRCDASPVGCAAVMEQEGRPVLFISKTLSPAERNYAQIEREALAIVWAIRRLHRYLFGRKFTLVTDNQPIKHIFSPDKAIPSVAAARIQRWALFLMTYNFEIQHIKGYANTVADYLSRFSQTNNEATFDVNMVQNWPNEAVVNKESVLAACKEDSLIRKLFNVTKWGWRKRQLQKSLYKYAPFRLELNIQDSLLYRGQRLVIPQKLQKEVLSKLHQSHSGAASMKAFARQCVWWLKINQDIEKIANQCPNCCKYKGSTQSAWTPWPEENSSWSRVHIDFAGPLKNGQYALVMVDAHSRWPEVHLMSSITSTETIRRLRRTFSQEGVPNVIVSDNGPSFVSSEMLNWLQMVGCRHVRTPPYHPRSNGLAERFVRTLKEAINAASQNNDIQRVVDRFLLMYRNTPHSVTGEAPAIRHRGHLLRTTLAALRSEGDGRIFVKSRSNDPIKWEPAKIINTEGDNIVQVKKEDDKIERYHLEDTKEDKRGIEVVKDKIETMEKEMDESTGNQRPKRTIRPPQRYGYEVKR